LSKKLRFSRWRRLPEVFRTGEHKFPETSPETQRMTLQLPIDVFETVEFLAAKLEKTTVREYCMELLIQAIESERVLHQVEEYQEKHGPLEGLAEIADDPEYLSEWEAQSRAKGAISSESGEHAQASPQHYVSFAREAPDEQEPLNPEILPADSFVDESRMEELPASSISWSVDPVVTSISESRMGKSLEESSVDIVRRHAGLGDGDHWSFLPSLRRGEPAPASMIEELLEALKQVENENRESTTLERSLAHCLHRLALESQVLLTEAWPGAFDERMVLAIRAVQEAVERILSGQDIRFYPAEPRSTASESPR